MSNNNLLQVRNLKKSFGGIQAVNVSNLVFQENLLTSIIGPNGAGKTTFFDLISRFQTQDDGEIHFEGKNISNSQPFKIARLGMVRTFQLTKVFERMNVLENLMFAGSSVKNDSFISSIIKLPSQKEYEEELKTKAFEVMKLLNLEDMASSYARELSGGQKKLLELGRAIVKSPRVLLLDEPLAGVNPKLSEQILEIINDLINEGKTVLMVEHNIEAVMRVSERVVVMAEGEIIADGPPNEIRTNEKVIAAYLGSDDG